MELIKKLKASKDIHGYWRSYGLFLCSYCNEEVKKFLGAGKKQKSCGCMKSEFLKAYKNALKDGYQSKNYKYKRLYRIWINMKSRCFNQKDINYHNYGGRGIKVCKEWKDNYIIFKNWALANGYNNNLEIDRKENNGNYEPSNCRFITHAKNLRNTRVNKLNWNKVNKIRKLYEQSNITQKQLGKLFGVSQSMIGCIINNKEWNIK